MGTSDMPSGTFSGCWAVCWAGQDWGAPSLSWLLVPPLHPTVCHQGLAHRRYHPKEAVMCPCRLKAVWHREGPSPTFSFTQVYPVVPVGPPLIYLQPLVGAGSGCLLEPFSRLDAGWYSPITMATPQPIMSTQAEQGALAPPGG